MTTQKFLAAARSRGASLWVRFGSEMTRITAIIGYSAETSQPNQRPTWGHFTSRYVDGIQEKFDHHLRSARAEARMEALRDALKLLQEIVPYNFELNSDGSEDYRTRSYVEGVRDSWDAIRELIGEEAR